MKPAFLKLLGISALCLITETAWAGPHLRAHLQNSFFRSFSGEIIIISLALFGLSLLAYKMTRKIRKAAQTKRRIQHIAAVDPRFQWTKLEAQFREQFNTVRSDAFRYDNQSAISVFCSVPFWTQDLAPMLKRWHTEGVTPHAKVLAIRSVLPLRVRHMPKTSNDDSSISVYFKAVVERYLEQSQSGAVIDGSTSGAVEESIWTWKLENNRWLLHNIETGEFLSVYLSLTSEVAI